MASIAEERVTSLAAQFGVDGFLKMEDSFDSHHLAQLHDKAMANFNEAISLIESNGLSIGIGIKHGFKDIVQRHSCRFEMPYKMDSEDFDMRQLDCSGTVMSVVHSILGNDAIVINRSLIVSLPGATVSSN